MEEEVLSRRRRFSKGWATDRSRFKLVFENIIYIHKISELVNIEALDDLCALGLGIQNCVWMFHPMARNKKNTPFESQLIFPSKTTIP